MRGPDTYLISHDEPHATWQRHKIPSGRVRRIDVAARGDSTGSSISATLTISFNGENTAHAIQCWIENTHRGSPVVVDVRSNGNVYTRMGAGPHLLADIILSYDGEA